MITSLFQDMSPTLLAVTLAVVTGGMVLVLLGLGAANPILLRMGLRNMTRRPSQTLVLLCGLALSTAVMTASFGLSDSIAASEVQQRLARMGTVDESITGPFTQAQVDTTLAQLRQDSHVAAASALFFAPQSPTVTLLRTGLSVHDVDLYAVPPDFDQVYGAITDSRERLVHFADLRPNEVLVSAMLAENLHISPGDTLQLSFEPSPSVVRAVLSNDIAVTAGEAVGNAPAEVILPLAHAQQIDPEPPDTISIKNRSGKVGSQAVIHLLQQLFPGASASLTVPHALGTTEFDAFRIHPLKPDVVERTTNLLQINKLVFLSSIGQQFSWLPPTFTWLLVGAGMLLLILLVILLATARRAELGISRAVGLQRGHLVQLLLFEGCGYALIAALFGLFLGIGATALELSLFSLLPKLGVGEAGNAVPISVITVGSLHLSLTWQSGLAAGCLGILTTMLAMLATALWISRITIVTAIRDLDAPPAVRLSLMRWARALMRPPADTNGQLIAETPARLRARQVGALLGLAWGLWQRGPLCLLAGGTLFAAGSSQETGWLKQLGAALFIAGVGLLVQWIGTVGGVSAELSRRLAWSLIGGGWLVYALLSENTFLSLFQPVVDFTGAPSTLELLLSMLVPVVGAVVLVMTNADLLGALITLVLQGFRGLAPISRTSLVYPLTFRFRSGVSVALLCLISFLVLFLVTTNVGAIQEAQAANNSGGFQVEATVFGSQLQRYPDLPTQLQALQDRTLLGQDFAAVGLVRLLYDYPESGAPQPLRLDLPGQPDYPLSQPPLVADDGFFSSVTLPLYARAQGFASDQQIWNAVRTHTGDAVIQYDSRLAGLPTSNGFAPFTAEIPDSSSPSAHDHPVTIIGLMPASTPWRVLLSLQTAGTIVQPPAIQFVNTYLFRLQAGVSEEQAAQDLNRTLQTALRGITVQSLDQGSLNGVTAVFTVLLAGYLALGLIFGVLAIGVIASRAVVERRQQIGMLRALGFSRALVRRAFLLESGAIITLGLFTGATLALWLATQVARATYQDLPLPIFPIALIFLGSFLAALMSTALPAQGAARLPPAEALRYE